MVDNLVKTASYLPPRTDISLSKIKEINRKIALDKWGRRWENKNFQKYKQSVPVLCKNSLRHTFLQLNKTRGK